MKKIIFILITNFLMADNGIYLGIQSSYPSDGLSVKVDIGQRTGFQAIADPLGTERSLAFRGIYKFKQDIFSNIYGYGEIGFWNWDRRYYSNETINSFGYGVGGGFEYDLRGLDANFIPLLVNVELNLHFFDEEDNYYYDGEELGLGFGVHYKF